MDRVGDLRIGDVHRLLELDFIGEELAEISLLSQQSPEVIVLLKVVIVSVAARH